MIDQRNFRKSMREVWAKALPWEMASAARRALDPALRRLVIKERNAPPRRRKRVPTLKERGMVAMSHRESLAAQYAGVVGSTCRGRPVARGHGLFASVGCAGKRLVAVLGLMMSPMAPSLAQAPDHADLALEARALPRDQARAFFQGRGFSGDISSQIADDCVMRLVLKNRSAGTIRLDLADWRTEREAHTRSLRLEADWQRMWAQTSVSPAAKIAFRYSLLPTVQTLAPGDWLQGMITADLRPGSAFDLRVAWSEDGKQRQTRLRGLRCAP